MRNNLMESGLMEYRLIENCAPTLAGIKCASLFNYFYTTKESAVNELTEINGLLNECGVYAEALLWKGQSVLVYVYRLAHLQQELNEPGIRELLAGYGYEEYEVTACIRHLKERLDRYTCFPHEIGVFLGYPLEDVKGFIQNEGQNCKSCGLWKVYCDVPQKEKMFDKLKKCSKMYLQVFSEGRKITQMTVCTGKERK